MKVDPFAEDSAPRQDVMSTVLGFMADKKFDDAIVIQGAPGAGKSTFTKKLCIRLHDEGLLPIRIPLQFLRVDANIFDAIQDVLVSFSDPSIGAFKRDLFADKVFSEQVEYGNSMISPYVFIFDGWDEISLSAAEGFQQRVERLLDRIRGTFLDQIRNKVRVVLTGRPSQAIGRSNFLRDDTPILTVRPITPEQLSRYINDLRDALDKPAFTGDDIDGWEIGDIGRFTPILQRYKRSFPTTRELEVIGQPLLAHLAIKVMASFKGNLEELITPPTTLYRHLVDLTCKKGGKAPTDRNGTGKSGRMAGKDLRALLHGTALAITAHGSESIPEEELELRLETLGVGTDIFLLTQKQITKEHPLTNLMISFYFKGVQERSGCEFLHKSFREYLAAEAIVEVLKEYAKSAPDDLPERTSESYWQDFRDGDPRFWLSRKLGEILSPHWMSRDVTNHVSELLRWEFGRSGGHASKPKEAELSTDPVTLNEWFKLRVALADLWDWWGEGVHLRTQPKEIQRVWNLDQSPYVVALARLAMRRWNAGRREPPHPVRTVTVDANLGHALFQLNCFVHGFISEEMGWTEKAKQLGPARLWSQITHGPRRYQVIVECDGAQFIQFSPSGDSTEYFRNYVNRVNAAGFVAGGPRELSSTGVRFDFPGQAFMRGVHLSGANLRALTFSGADMATCNLEGAELSEAQLVGTVLDFANLRAAFLFSTHLYEAYINGADVSMARMPYTDLRRTPLKRVQGLTQAQLNDAEDGDVEVSLPEGLIRPNHWRSVRLQAQQNSTRGRNSPESHSEEDIPS
jgi:hypothetical protein